MIEPEFQRVYVYNQLQTTLKVFAKPADALFFMAFIHDVLHDLVPGFYPR